MCTPTRNAADRLINAEAQEEKKPDVVQFEFAIEGMTCVACSGAIERGMKITFDSKGLIEICVALLVHKMTISFRADEIDKQQITPEIICEEVEDIGFGCEWLNTFEFHNDARTNTKKKNTELKSKSANRIIRESMMSSASNQSIDSEQFGIANFLQEDQNEE